MATIPAPDLVKLRTQQQRSIGYLSVLKPTVLLTAAVTGAPTRGQRAISYNGGVSSSFSTIEEGQTVIFNTAYGVFRGRVKAIAGAAAAGTITLDENGFLLTNGDTITIYHNYEIHPIPPAIRSQIFYKFYNTAYSNQNSQPNPVAIAGPHKVGWLTSHTVTVKVATGNDNGNVVGPGFLPNSATIQVGLVGGFDGNAWLRFQNVQIPNAAVITAASISLTPNGNQSSTVALNIYGENADNPTAPTSAVDYNGRAVTAAVAWNFSTAWTNLVPISTPSLITPVQALVNRAGWASGNAMQFFIKNNGGADKRVIKGFSAGYYATLTITYVTPATFSLDGSDSYAIANGATISSYLWSCVHNGGGTTGVSFSATNVAAPTLTITQAGQYWLKLTVTDSNSKTQSTYRALWVYDRNGTQPYTDFSVQSLAGDWQSGGWKCTLNATGDVDLSDFPDWALVAISYDNYFNDTEGYVNLWDEGDNIIICGYLRQDTDNDDFADGTGNVTFSITTVDDLLNNVCELGTVSLNAVASPTKWYEYASWMTAGRSIHHLILWHSWGVIETCDILGLTTNTLGVKNTDYSESSLLQQVNVFTSQRGIFAKLMSNRLGQMYLVVDSQMLNTAGRAALDTIFTITTADISGVIDVVRSPEESIVFAQLDGFKFDGSASTPYVSIVPGYRESSVSYIIPNERGSSVVSVSNQVLASQTDANEKVGRYVALANNNPRELRFSTPGNYLGAFDIIPSQGWYVWGISDVSLKRNTELNSKKFVCRNVSHSLDFQSGVIQTSVVLEKEAIGPDGIVGNYPTSYPTVTPPEPTWNSGQANTSLADFIMAYASSSASAYYVKAGRYSGGTISVSAANQQICANTNVLPVLVCGLNSTKGLAFYVRNGVGICARTVNVNASTLAITLGAETVIDASGATPNSVVALSSTQVLAAYDETVIILDISGDTITPGNSDALEVGALGVWLCRLSSTLACATYYLADTVVKAVSVSISGSTPTLNTPQNITSSPIASLRGTNIIALDNTTAIVLYLIVDKLRSVAIYNITSSFTLGSDIELVAANAFSAGGNGLPYGTRLLSTEMPYIWQDRSAVPFIIKANSVTYSGGGNISDGTEMTASSGAGDRGIASICAISNNRMAIVYSYFVGADYDVYVKTLSYSGGINDDANEIQVDTGLASSGANTSSIAVLRDGI